ncbi:MAG: flavodoxin domain-containing protein [Anaerolineales bacterium]|nr:flavodoxin domain-containing protein [Anaerolineales bacterium]
MSVKTLVAYASKSGGTEQFAHAIGEVMRFACRTVGVQIVDKVDTLDGNQAVVLGSAVYVGQWRKEAVTFLEANETSLASRQVWLFSSGPTGVGDPVELVKGVRLPGALQPVADRIRPRDIAFSHGVLDTKKVSLAERLVIKGVKAPVGDFRDWEQIRAWAASIASALSEGSG